MRAKSTAVLQSWNDGEGVEIHCWPTSRRWRCSMPGNAYDMRKTRWKTYQSLQTCAIHMATRTVGQGDNRRTCAPHRLECYRQGNKTGACTDEAHESPSSEVSRFPAPCCSPPACLASAWLVFGPHGSHHNGMRSLHPSLPYALNQVEKTHFQLRSVGSLMSIGVCAC